ncbi:MAG TPA: class I SAM-dependent methyltransferase [Puia sp.]|nr:class I SAM-dependent methyltransferase [Puia sp.]
MRTKVIYDPDFLHCSPELKRLLNGSLIAPGSLCIDAPCGIGRNTFLLASRFQQVMAIDRNTHFLQMVSASRAEYAQIKGHVTCEQLDLEGRLPAVFHEADLIATIHYYSQPFISRVLSQMKPGALFYLETPSCSGENRLELPTDHDIQTFSNASELLMFKRNACRSDGHPRKSFSLKTLIKKPYG